MNTTVAHHTTPSVRTTTNFKQYFIECDALKNITSELVFSITKRYMCKAGCSMCYIKDQWIPDAEFDALVPIDIPEAVESKLLEFFKYFDTITTMDDLFWLKRKHPHLYGFYLRNSHLFSSTSMSDNAFLQQYDIVTKEMNFRSIYEVSFSDTFLEKQSGGLVDTVIDKLGVMNAKTPIKKVKLVLCKEDGDTQPGVVKLVAWAHQHGIHVSVQDDITQSKNRVWDLNVSDSQSDNYYSEDSKMFQVLCEVTHMQYTSVFHTINQAISQASVPFYDIVENGVNISTFITQSLVSKLETYARYASMIRHKKDNKFYDYFSYVAAAVKVNKGFNYIPNLVLPKWTALYQGASNTTEFVDTPYGLCKQDVRETIVPLFEVLSQPKQRLYHIPIKCTLVKNK